MWVGGTGDYIIFKVINFKNLTHYLMTINIFYTAFLAIYKIIFIYLFIFYAEEESRSGYYYQNYQF